MAFTRPKLSQIIERVESDLKNGLGLTAILRRSFEYVLARVLGGLSHVLHGHIDYAIVMKFFLDTGDEETVVRWGTIYNLPRKDATFAELVVDVVGTSGGSVVGGATIFVRSDGVEYIVKDSTVIPASTTVPVTIVAQVEGDSGNMNDGDSVELQSAIAGIESAALVTSTSIEGADLEDLELYRERVLARLQNPPAGGKVTDYIAFAKTVTGVTRAWVLPNHIGQGTVGLTFVEDNEVPIIPDASKVQEVQEAVLALQPINADLITFIPNETEMNPQIQLKPNTSDVQDAVTAELNDMLQREAQVRDASDPDKVGQGVQFDGKIALSLINEAISIAAGEEDHVILSPTTDVQPLSGGIVTLGTPIFTTLP